MYFRSLNRFILISLALLGMSVSSVNAATLLYDESIDGETSRNDPQSLGIPVAGDYVLGVSANDPDGWWFYRDDSVDEIIFEATSGQMLDRWELCWGAPFACLSVSPGDAYLQNYHVWDVRLVTPGSAGKLWLRNFDIPANSDYAYRVSFVSAVPVPAAVWLFGTAIIGLVGLGKRGKTA